MAGGRVRDEKSTRRLPAFSWTSVEGEIRENGVIFSPGDMTVTVTRDSHARRQEGELAYNKKVSRV